MSKKKKRDINDFSAIKNKKYYKQEIEELNNYIFKKKVTNIGVLGPYSSGKSSFIKSYKTWLRRKEIITVSLGKYNEYKQEYANDKTELKDNISKNSEEVNNGKTIYINNYMNDDTIGKVSQDHRLERDILEQLLLSRHPMKYTSTRGPVYKFIKILMFVIFISTMLIISINNVSFLRKINEHNFLVNTQLNNYSIMSLFFILSIFLFRIIYLIISGKLIRHIKYDNLELTFEMKNESPVDENIVELIDFFKECRASIIVFEDLDRFNNIENILVKLKDINSIINTRRRFRFFLMKRFQTRMTFIYSVSDNEIKKASNRTKFFDAIIPLRNVLDRETITKNINSLSKEIDISIIHLVNEYITDMRLFKSVKNDYNNIEISSQINTNTEFLDKKNKTKIEFNKEKANNIFVLALYKNLFPSDFQLVYNFKSDINKIFNLKNIIADKINNQNIEEIKKIDKLIAKKENEKLDNVDELLIILSKHIEELKQQNSYIRLKVNDSYKFESNKVPIKYEYYSYSGVREETFQLDSEKYKKFKERYLALDANSDELINEKKILNNRSDEITKLNINEIFQEYNQIAKETIGNYLSGKNINFLVEAISSNYLTDKFQDLLFRPENLILQGDDQIFFRNIRDGIPSINLRLNNYELLIAEINPNQFDTINIINIDLITYLYSKKEKKFTSRFTSIKNQFKINLDTIIRVYKMESITKLDSNILVELLFESDQIFEFITKCNKDIKTNLIFDLMTKKDFNTNDKVTLNSLVNEHLDFSKVILEHDKKNVMKNIINNNIVVEKIDVNTELIREIYTNEMFSLNKNNIDFFVHEYRKDKNYKNIIKDIIDDKLSISSYLKKNFDKFIKEIWINLDEVYEDNDTIILLSNFEGVTDEIFKSIIIKNNSKIYNVENLNSQYLSIVLENKMLENRLSDLIYLIKIKESNNYIYDLTNIVIDTDNLVSFNEVVLLLNNKKIDIEELKKIQFKNEDFEFIKITNEKYLLQRFEFINKHDYETLLKYSYKNKMIDIQKKLLDVSPEHFSYKNTDFILDDLYTSFFNLNNAANVRDFIINKPEIVLENIEENRNTLFNQIKDLAKEQVIDKRIVMKAFKMENNNELLINQFELNNITRDDIKEIFRESSDYKKNIKNDELRFSIKLEDLELLKYLEKNNIISLRKVKNKVQEDYKIKFV